MNLKEKTALAIKHVDYLSGHDDAPEKDVSAALIEVRAAVDDRLKNLGDERAERELKKAAFLEAKAENKPAAQEDAAAK